MKSKFLNDTVEYPTVAELAITGFTPGVMYEYVSGTFLNGWINYVKPVKAYLLERYRVFNQERFNQILKDQEKEVHTKLDVFDDDVLLIGRIKSKHAYQYMFFWFDMDVSDCCIGLLDSQQTNENEVVLDFTELAKSFAENVSGAIIEDAHSGGPGVTTNNIHDIPLSFFKGWIKF